MEGEVMKRVFIVMLVLCFGLLLNAQEKGLKDFISEAQVLKQEGKFKEAVNLMQEAVGTYPEEVDVHLQLGLAWGDFCRKAGETGDMMGAMDGVNGFFSGMEKVLELDPDNFDAHFYYGVWGINVPPFFGKLDQGVGHLEKVLDLLADKSGEGIEEQKAACYQYLGQGYRNQGRLADAKSAWEKALKLSPEGEISEFVQKGLKELAEAETSAPKAEQEQKDESENILALKGRIKKSPDDFDAYLELGKIYFDEKKWPEAATVLKEAVKLDENHAEAQFLLTMAIIQDTQKGYDEQIYENTDRLSGLAFEIIHQLKRTLELDPDNVEARLWYAVSCVQMPFFVGKIDEGLAILEEMASDENLPEEVRSEVLYQLGFGYRKKGNAVWMKLVKDHPQVDQVKAVYDEYGLREHGKEVISKEEDKVVVTFHLGFKDELPPQTGVWVEDSEGEFVKTLYVSGFSGYAKEKQVNLPNWSKSSDFETDGTTAASIDWGKHSYVWDLTDHQGKRVKDGLYKVNVEVSWWPSMKYGRASAEIRVGKTSDEKTVEKGPFIPLMRVQYLN